MRKNLLFLLIIINFLPLFSQKETYNWTFGDSCGLSFNTPTLEPVAFKSSISTREGCATVSDKEGNLLFYTSGINVFDNRHKLMSNGQGLRGDSSSTESAIIVKQPGNENIYYIFTVGAVENINAGGMYYSIVDMSLNNNLGQVTQKNIKINSFAIERLCAVGKYENSGYWVICYNFKESSFYAYEITATGFNPTVVKSPASISDNFGYYLKANRRGDLLAIARGNYEQISIYQFNSHTGEINLKYNLPIDKANFYGCEFSNDGSKLYITSFWESPNQVSYIGQFDLSSENELSIINSFTKIAEVNQSTSFGALQIAPNDKIYIAIENSDYLSVIQKPDLGGVSCGFRLNGVKLKGFSKLGLPNIFPSFCQNINQNFDPELPDTLFVCPDKKILVGNSEDTNFIYSWRPSNLFENPSQAQTFAILKQNTVLHLFATSNSTGCLFEDSIIVFVDTTRYKIQGNPAFCQSDSVYLYLDSNLLDVRWSTGDTSNGIWVKSAAKITVTATNFMGCSVSDSIVTGSLPIPESEIVVDTLGCQNGIVFYKLSLADTNLFVTEWSTGESDKSINVSNSGKIWVKFNNQFGCQGYSEININQDTTKLRIYGTREFCDGDSTVLSVDDKFTGTKWSDGTIGTTVTIKASGRYIAAFVNQFGCVLTDTTDVIVHPNPLTAIEQLGDFCSDNLDKIELRIKDTTLNVIRWSTGETSKNIFIKDTGLFWVDYSNEFGCTAHSEITVINKTLGTKTLNEQLFDNLCKGSQYYPIVELINTYFGDLIIDSVYLSSKNQNELKLNDAEKYLTQLKNNDTMLFNLKYLPTIAQDYFDTLNVIFGNPCRGEYRIPLQFNSLPAKIEIGSVDTLVNFGDTVCIPLWGKYLCDGAANLTTMYHLTIKIDASLFVPDSVKFGKIDSMWIKDGFYYIFITDSNCNLTKNQEIINYLCGEFYKGNSPSSAIEIVKMDFDNGADTSTTNGSIKGEICQFGIRGIELFDINSLIVQPNPATDQIKLNVTNSDKGEIDFDIINSVGNAVATWTVNKSDSDSDKFEISRDINDFGSGVYIVRMRSAAGIVTGMFAIVK